MLAVPDTVSGLFNDLNISPARRAEIMATPGFIKSVLDTLEGQPRAFLAKHLMSEISAFRPEERDRILSSEGVVLSLLQSGQGQEITDAIFSLRGKRFWEIFSRDSFLKDLFESCSGNRLALLDRFHFFTRRSGRSLQTKFSERREVGVSSREESFPDPDKEWVSEVPVMGERETLPGRSLRAGGQDSVFDAAQSSKVSPRSLSRVHAPLSAPSPSERLKSNAGKPVEERRRPGRPAKGDSAKREPPSMPGQAALVAKIGVAEASKPVQTRLQEVFPKPDGLPRVPSRVEPAPSMVDSRPKPKVNAEPAKSVEERRRPGRSAKGDSAKREPSSMPGQAASGAKIGVAEASKPVQDRLKSSLSKKEAPKVAGKDMGFDDLDLDGDSWEDEDIRSSYPRRRSKTGVPDRRVVTAFSKPKRQDEIWREFRLISTQAERKEALETAGLADMVWEDIRTFSSEEQAQALSLKGLLADLLCNVSEQRQDRIISVLRTFSGEQLTKIFAANDPQRVFEVMSLKDSVFFSGKIPENSKRAGSPSGRAASLYPAPARSL